VDEWSYRPAPNLERSIAERMRGFPRSPDMSVYLLRAAVQLALRGFLRGYHRLRVSGREHLPPREASFVLVCNHASHLDALSLLAALPLRRVHRAFPAAAADYFFASLPRTLFSVLAVNGLPFDRESKGGESLEICRQVLAQPGNVLILFPEGTRSTSHAIGRFRSGIGRLAAGTATPIVPCHLAGAHAAFPKGASFPRPHRLALRIGPPRSFAHVSPDDRSGVERICTELRDAVIALADAAEPQPAPLRPPR
jgi:1-acyl-sn-glycerol-3-phosphate acyltransferase